MIDAILLSSGFSKRFGENKLTSHLGGKMLYEHTLDMVLSCGIFKNVFIVSQYDKILEKSKSAIPIKNEHSFEGISKSIKLGVQESSSPFYMFFVCDTPLIKKETVLDFYSKFMDSKKGMGFIKTGYSYGIPAIFSDKYKNEILNLSRDSGAKSISKKHPEDVFLYEVKDSLEFFDCDTKKDFIFIEENYFKK